MQKNLVISKKSSTFAGFFKESTLKSVSRIARRVVAQPGRVRVWGACGRKFESCHPDIPKAKGLFQPLYLYI